MLKNKIKKINLNNNDEEMVTPAEGKIEALRQFEKEFKNMKASQKLLHELLSKSQDDTVVKIAKNQNNSIIMMSGVQ
jgi:hypothetical protein